MTQRYKAFLVTLANDIREDDADAILTALRMVKGVLDVSPVGADMNDHTIRTRVLSEVQDKLHRLLNELWKG